jgi:hypothetical protein
VANLLEPLDPDEREELQRLVARVLSLAESSRTSSAR